MGARLISFFGTGDWEPVRYRLGDKVAQETGLLPAAMVDLYDQAAGSEEQRITSVVIVGTCEAHEHYSTQFALERAKLEARFTGRFAFDVIGHGEREEDQRFIFERVVRWLQPDARREQLLGFEEVEAPSEIVLDITHGLRPQALIAGAAVTFVLAEAVRRAKPKQPLGPIRVLYGRHEPGDGRDVPDYTAPLWDLTDFVSTTLWTLAIQAVRYGRGDAADVLAAQESRRWKDEALERGARGIELRQDSFIGRLGDALRAFSDGLAFLRAKDLLTKHAPRLAGLLASADRRLLIERRPVLSGLLDDLELDAVKVSSEKVLDASGLRALLHLARLYGRLERFAEQAATIREAYLTYFSHAYLGQSTPAEPGSKDAWSERLRVEASVPRDPPLDAEDDREALAPFPLVRDVDRETIADLNKARDIRNNMLHLALTQNQDTPGSLRTWLEETLQSLAQRVGGPVGRTE